MKISRFFDEIIKIIKEFVNENDLDDSEYQRKVGEILEKEGNLLLDSEMLGFDSSTYFCLMEFQNEGEKNESYLDDFFKNIKDIKNKKKDSFDKYEFVIIVRSISNKILLDEELKKRLRIRSTQIKIAFIPKQNRKEFSINVSSNIQNIEYQIDNNHIASIFTAKLYDLVELYNFKGDALFSDNVRFQIADKLDVDKEIEKTLWEEPDKFWLYNNGITLLVDKACIDTKKQRIINIKVSPSDKISVINGAQTISAASNFFYSNKKDSDEIKKAKDKVDVVLRVVFFDEEIEKTMYSKICLSLNRQKAITEANMRYIDPLVEDINKLYNKYKETPYFYIAKDGESIGHDKVDIAYFAKISAIYLLQQPGTARNSKGDIIKDDKYWTELQLKWDDENEAASSFIIKYKPFLYVLKLFEKLSVRMKKHENSEDKSFANWCKYGTEFLVAYIVWRMNEKKIDDFSNFKVNNSSNIDDKILDKIISSFAKYAKELYKGEDIDSNLTKKNSEYEKLRKYLDEKGQELVENINKLK